MAPALARIALVAGVGVGLAACAQDVVGPSYVGNYDPGELRYVAGKGSLHTQVVGNPFATPPEEVERAVTAAMYGAHAGPRVRFSPEADPRNPSPYRVVMVLNPAPGVAEGSVCTSAASADAAVGEPLRVVAAFCAGSDRETSVSGRVDGATGPDDPAFGALIRQMTAQLFPPRNPQPIDGADFDI